MRELCINKFRIPDSGFRIQNSLFTIHYSQFIEMAQKKPFVLRLDEQTLEAVEKWAEDEFRSTNGQLEWIISKALKEAGRAKKEKGEQKAKG